MKKITILLLLFVSFKFTIAQDDNIDVNHDKGLEAYASFSGGFPIKGMEHYDYSIGAYTHFDYNFNEHIVARVDIGWNEFYGPDRNYTDVNGTIHKEEVNMSVWEFTAGARYRMSIFYAEARGGYFTGIHKWGAVPAIGVKYKAFDVQANIIMAKDMQWGGVRIGYFF